MIFASDNWTGASDEVMVALNDVARTSGPAYGGDPLTASVGEAFSRLFERDVAVFFVATGTAANSLALAQFSRPGGVVFCHADAHIVADEGGAPEFFGGSRLHGIAGDHGQFSAVELAAAIVRYPPAFVHHGQPTAVSISQLTEAGTAYSPEAIASIARVAHAAGLPLHMDGARFANAVVGLGISPAEATWKAGVDVLSFGGSKNGCLAAEAVVFFDRKQAEGFEFHRKRAGQLFSKSRFVAAQFSAYLANGHWLQLASHANAMAARLADGIEAASGAYLAETPEGNELFAVLPKDASDRLKAAGAVYYDWPATGMLEKPLGTHEALIRLVTSFRTTENEVERFVEILAG